MSKKNKQNQQRSFETNQAQVDLIIPTRGRLDLLERCYSYISEAFNPYTVNVIIVDNASFEVDAENVGFLDEIQGYKDSVIKSTSILPQKTNLGFPRACNLGARRKTSPLIFFLNSDCFLEPGSGKLLVDEMNNNPKTGVAGMKLLFPEYPTGLRQDEHMRMPGRIQHVGLSTRINGTVHHVFIGWRPDHPKVNKIREVFAVTGAALMVRRNLFHRVGGFFEGYGLGTFEDVDLCCSIRNLEYNIVVVPEAVGTHYTGATAETYKIPYPMNENASIFLSRHTKDLMWWDYFLL